MNKKTVLQGLMISLIVVISLSFYLRYFNEGPETVIENKTLEKQN